MSALFRWVGLALVCSSVAAHAAPGAAPAASAMPADGVGRSAGAACEAAVADNVREVRGSQAQDIQFIGEKRRLAASPEDETAVKGEGRYRMANGGQMPFTYRCVFSAKTQATTGVVFSETGVNRTQAVEKPWQPDIVNLSTEACEAGVAAALKSKHPRVGRIAFGSDSRQLRPSANGGTRLEGQGGVERALGMSSIPFSYRCEYDTRTSKFLSAQVNE
ncbi:MAG: hypothetical protein RLZZ618_169 [Pseudomonadota bacterium]